MILEDMMKDGRRITFDCVFQKRGECCTLGGSVSKIEMDDSFYGEKEVQNAIKQDLVKVVGEPPVLVQSAPKAEERKVRLRNVWGSKIAIDCIRDYVEPGHVISVAESVLLTEEVRNALESRMLVDADAPEMPAMERDTTAVLTELGSGDIVTKAPETAEPATFEEIIPKATTRPQPAMPQPKAAGVAGKRVKAKATSPIKARKIDAIGANDTKSPLDSSPDDDDGSLFKESKLAIRQTIPEPLKPKVEPVSQDVLDFIFGEEKEK